MSGSLFRTPGLGEAVDGLAGALFGSSRREGDRLRNLAYAEQARSQIEFNRARTREQEDANNLRAKRGALLAELVAQGVSPQQIAAQMAPLLIQAAGADAPALRVGLGAAVAPGSPREVADVVGAIGGNAGHTRYGVDEGNATAIRQSGIAAGATLGAARIREAGEMARFNQRDIQPGVIVAPGRATTMGLPGAQPGAAYYVPAPVTIAPGATRSDMRPGPMLGDTVQMAPPLTAPAQERSTLGGYATDLARRVAHNEPGALDELRRFESGVGVAVRDALLPQVAAAGVRNEGALAVQGLRNDGAATVQGLRNDGAATVQGLRNDGAATVQGMRGDTQREVAGIRADAAQNVAQTNARARLEAAQARPSAPLTSAQQDLIDAAMDRAGVQDARVRAIVGETAARYVQAGNAATIDAAIIDVVRDMVEAGVIRNNGWVRDRYILGPNAPANASIPRQQPGAARAPGAPTAAPPRASALPPAQTDTGTPREGQTATNPRTGERIIFRNGRWEPMA